MSVLAFSLLLLPCCLCSSMILHFASWTKCQQPPQPCASSHPSLNTHLCQSNALELLCQINEVACKKQPVLFSLLLLHYLQVKYPVCNYQSWTHRLRITWDSLILGLLPAKALFCATVRPDLSLFRVCAQYSIALVQGTFALLSPNSRQTTEKS